MIDLAYFKPGLMFTGLSKAPKLTDLAVIKASYAVEATGAEGTKSNMAMYTPTSGGWSALVPFDLPFHRTEYLNTDAPWSGDFMQQLPAVGDDFPAMLSQTSSGRQPYRAGHTYRQEWNRAVFGPVVTQPPFEGLWATRQGDHLIADIPMFGEGSGHPGFSTVDAESVALYQGTTKIGEGNEYDLPAGAATYRLEATSTRSAPHTLSTSVSGVWTFKSGHVDGTAYAPLSLSTVRFSPKLDERNSAHAGCRFEIPVTVEHQPGADTGRVRSIRVEVSYDDGKSWRAAAVRGSGDQRIATVRHPGSPGFVSLRVNAVDTKGNTVQETMIRAYAIG
jgi:hypothetical protein